MENYRLHLNATLAFTEGKENRNRMSFSIQDSGLVN